jgi:hypothetical protein
MTHPAPIEPLKIAGTEETPDVDFNISTGQFAIVGRSLPEDAYTFYRPVMDWINKYIVDCTESFDLKIHLDYFNSSSGRYLLEMLVSMEEKLSNTSLVSIDWVVDEDDELMIEKGEEFQSLLDLSITITTIPEPS